MVKFGSIFGSKKDESGEAALDRKDLAERKALARNTDAPREVLGQLASDKDGEMGGRLHITRMLLLKFWKNCQVTTSGK